MNEWKSQLCVPRRDATPKVEEKKTVWCAESVLCAQHTRTNEKINKRIIITKINTNKETASVLLVAIDDARTTSVASDGIEPNE